MCNFVILWLFLCWLYVYEICFVVNGCCYVGVFGKEFCCLFCCFVKCVILCVLYCLCVWLC